MPSELMTSRQVATALDVPYSTLRGWAKKYGVPATETRADGADLYGAEGLAIFNRIKELLDSGKGKVDADGILPILQQEFTSLREVSDPSQTPPGGRSEPSGFDMQQMQQIVTTAVQVVIREENELAEKYARATYEIGSLKQQVKQLEEQKADLKVLADPRQLQQLEQERQQLQLENHTLSEAKTRLAEDVTQLRSREQSIQTQLQETQQAEREAYQKAAQLAQEKAEAESLAKTLEAEQTRLRQELEQERQRALREQEGLKAELAAKAAELAEATRPRGLWERITGKPVRHETEDRPQNDAPGELQGQLIN